MLADDGAPLELLEPDELLGWMLLEALVVANELEVRLVEDWLLLDWALLLDELAMLPDAVVLTISELEKFDLLPTISIALTV